MEETLVNRVAQSGLITLNLENFFPEGEMSHFDLKSFLFMELILKEKDFREALKNHDWQQYEGKNLLVYCSTDAIIPVWAYMLVVTYAESFAKEIFQGDEEDFIKSYYFNTIENMDLSAFEGQKLVVKGCSDLPVPPAAYLFLTKKLRPIAQSIMYGEPCSTVPIYKKAKTATV
jgi:Protein of unknown function (DUF2480)